MRQMLKHDLQYGLRKQWKLYVAYGAMLFIICFYWQDTFTILQNNQQIGHIRYTVMDYLMHIVRGMSIEDIKENSVFRIPTLWISLYIILAYLVGYYAEKDMQSYGMYSLLAIKSRTKWWLSKCVWCIGSVTMFYLVALAVSACYAMATGGSMSLDYHSEVAVALNSSAVFLQHDYRILLMIVVLPWLMACALSVLQMLCSLLTGSVISFAGLCILYILSLYYNTPVSPVNYLMWYRNDIVVTKGGCNTLIGILYALILIVVGIMAGTIYLHKYDMLSKQ